MILADTTTAAFGSGGTQAAQPLLAIGPRPVLARQLAQLAAAGCIRAVIVTSNATRDQVADLLVRAYQGLEREFEVVERSDECDGLASIVLALERVRTAGPLTVLTSDAYLGPRDVLPDLGRDWALVAAPLSKLPRRCCYPTSDGFADGMLCPPRVCVGMFNFVDLDALRDTALAEQLATETPATIASILNGYAARRHAAIDCVPAEDWIDTAGASGLAAAGSMHFFSRPFHDVTLSPDGVVRKEGTTASFQAELDFVSSLTGGRASLYPAVHSVDAHSYSMDFVEMPTLAQLYLYSSSPGGPHFWQDVVSTVLNSLTRLHWPLDDEPRSAHALVHRAAAVYIAKPRLRFEDALRRRLIPSSRDLRINGRLMLAGESLLAELAAAVETAIVPTVKAGVIHGDPNFSNILYSPTTRSLKMVDPRGEWGGIGATGDVRYDVAKIRYSYASGFSAIMHGLFSVTGSGREWALGLGPLRDTEIAAMDEVLFGEFDRASIALIEATLLMSAPPLHAPDEAMALYLRAVESTNRILA